jgi:hypothetical protein
LNLKKESYSSSSDEKKSQKGGIDSNISRKVKLQRLISQKLKEI